MIVCVAVRHSCGLICSVPKPGRHDVVMGSMYDLGILEPSSDAGFLDDKGNFLNRRESYKHAVDCGQIEDDADTSDQECLISEMLWEYEEEKS